MAVKSLIVLVPGQRLGGEQTGINVTKHSSFFFVTDAKAKLASVLVIGKLCKAIAILIG
jgi:hypothetical protein